MKDNTIQVEREKFIRHFSNFDADSRYPMPFAQFSGRPGANYGPIKYDTMGFRNEKAIADRQDMGEFRIFVLGGSTMVVGESCQDTVPGRLNEIICSSGKKNFQVYNFGVISTVFSQMSVLLWAHLSKYDPDIIVIVGGGTDLTSPWSFDPRPGYPYNSFVIEEIYDYLFNISKSDKDKFDSHYEYLTEMLYQRLAQLRVSVGWKSKEWEADVVSHTKRSMHQFALMAQMLQRPVLFVLQPTIVRSAQKCSGDVRAGSNEYLDYLDRQYTELSRSLMEISVEQRRNKYFIPCDISDLFAQNDAHIFYDAAHYSEQGRQLVAEELYRQIDDRILQKSLVQRRNIMGSNGAAGSRLLTLCKNLHLID